MSELTMERLRENLESLKMKNTLEILDNYLERAVKDKLNVVEVLDHIFAEEALNKRRRAYEKQVQMSGFPIKKTLDDFDFAFQPSIDKRQIDEFYTDLEEQNKMDLKPFLELDLLDIRETLVPELKRFCKGNFNVDEVFNSASELKYSNEIRSYFDGQLRDPSDDFVKFLLAHTYDGIKTQAVVDKFKPLVKTTLNNYISELMNDKITSALKTERVSTSSAAEPATPSAHVEIDESVKSKIVTTQEELEALGIIKGLLFDVLDCQRRYKNAEKRQLKFVRFQG